jgi:hypothetical protein
VRLARSPAHHLVLAIADDAVRFALVCAAPVAGAPVAQLEMRDIGWLDVPRICAEAGVRREQRPSAPGNSQEEKGDDEEEDAAFTLDIQVLRALYAYCWFELHQARSSIMLTLPTVLG